MALKYKRIGATTDGYRGKRAILEERVIEGLNSNPIFVEGKLVLNTDSARTIYFKSNIEEGNKIILPDVFTLWNNWQITFINDSAINIPIYYFNEDSQLNLFKTLAAGTMLTVILVDNTATDQQGWTTLRTSEASIGDRYITTVLDTLTVDYKQLLPLESEDTISFPLSTILKGTPVKSIYIKPTEMFEGDVSLKLSIGTEDNNTLFYNNLDITNSISNNNFSKDIFEEILSTQEDVDIFAYFGGNNLASLEAGSINITVERIKEIDPTLLNNAIVQTQLPIGTILPYVFDGNNPPEGFWPLNGSLVPNARTSIPQFIKKLEDTDNNLDLSNKLIIGLQQWNQIYNTYGSCGKFAWSGSDLKFPAINCFIQGLGSIGTLNDLGKLIPAGLPNHIHAFGYNSGNNNGNFVATNSSKNYSFGEEKILRNWNGSGGGGTPVSSIDPYSGNMVTTLAKTDNSNIDGVFGNSATVQPQSIKYPYIISIYNKIQNAAYIDLLELKENSVDKANITLDNVSNISGFRKLIEVYKGTNAWYKIFSEYDPETGSFVGYWCEQGGNISVVSGDNDITVNLLKEFDGNYTVFKNYNSNKSTNALDYEVSCYDKTSTSFKTHCNSVDTSSFDWYACGYTKKISYTTFNFPLTSDLIDLTGNASLYMRSSSFDNAYSFADLSGSGPSLGITNYNYAYLTLDSVEPYLIGTGDYRISANVYIPTPTQTNYMFSICPFAFYATTSVYHIPFSVAISVRRWYSATTTVKIGIMRSTSYTTQVFDSTTVFEASDTSSFFNKWHDITWVRKNGTTSISIDGTSYVVSTASYELSQDSHYTSFYATVLGVSSAYADGSNSSGNNNFKIKNVKFYSY